MDSTLIPSVQESRELHAFMRSLPSDEFARWMIEHRRYDVDPEEPRVWNVATGQVLSPIRKSNGYYSVTLYFARGIFRQISVHRLVAVKVWGTESIRGKQVGHRDHVKSHNQISNLWLPATAKEHFDNDGTIEVIRPHFLKPRVSWLACVSCGDPDGPIQTKSRTPARRSGSPFGISGEICLRCFNRLKSIEHLSDSELASLSSAIDIAIRQRMSA